MFKVKPGLATTLTSSFGKIQRWTPHEGLAESRRLQAITRSDCATDAHVSPEGVVTGQRLRDNTRMDIQRDRQHTLADDI